MKQTFIWDLDGTLLDSYPVIDAATDYACRQYGINLKREDIHRRLIATSVRDFLHAIAVETGNSYADMRALYDAFAAEHKYEFGLIPQARETLAALAEQGAVHIVYTHRGDTTAPVLKHLEIDHFFLETVTALNGFGRKPCPDALNYLVEKYQLDRSETCYVGDRTIDMDCAKNAGIQGILYLPEGSCCHPDGSESMIVHELAEIAAWHRRKI